MAAWPRFTHGISRVHPAYPTAGCTAHAGASAESALHLRLCVQSCLPTQHAGLLLTPSLSRLLGPEPSLPRPSGLSSGAPFSLTAEEEPAAPS